MSETAHRPIEYMRADAARNLHRIVEVAARLLGEDPNAGMAEVAMAAGMSRATVYRHFATRPALVSAIRRQGTEQAEHALAECRLGDGTPTEALERLVRAWLDLAERYSFPQLATQTGDDSADEALQHRRRVFSAPVIALIERGQAAGEFSTERSAEWLARVFGGLVLAGARALGDGTLSRKDGPEVVFHTLLDGLRP